MNVLSIGNSFSQDAHRWLHDAASSVGIEICCVNLYIGGCSLKRHRDNLISGEAAYSMEENGISVRRVSLPDALRLKKWDVITLQQVSGQSGLYDTWEPYLTELFRAVTEACPEARVLLHKTWSYESDSSHPDFENYGRDQEKMDISIAEAYRLASVKYALGVIDTGSVIRDLRGNTKEFDRSRGGIALTRDGFHLSLDYGRYAAALVWLKALTGADVRRVTFVPQKDGIPANTALLDIIKKVVNQANSTQHAQ